MARYIITGAAGFIGSNLALALNRRGETGLLLVDNLNHPLKQENLRRLTYQEYMDKSQFIELLAAGKIEPPEAVIHLGACSSTTELDEAYLDHNNFAYSETLSRWCLEHDRRFVYASSAATYGDGSLGYSDDDRITPQLQPLNPYGRSKQKFDCLALREGWLPVIAGIKFFNVFGPGEGHKGEMRSLVNKAYHQIMAQGRIDLFRSYRKDYGDGEQRRDFVHVSDAVAIVLFFLDNPGVGGLFNCGTGYSRSWLDLAHGLFTAMRREPAIRFVDMPRKIRGCYQYHTQADLAKLRRAGCRHQFMSLEDGISDYVTNYLATGNSDRRETVRPVC